MRVLLSFVCLVTGHHKPVEVWLGPVWLHRYADQCGRCGKVVSRNSRGEGRW